VNAPGGTDGRVYDKPRVLRALLLEDSRTAAEALRVRLSEAGILHELTRVASRNAFEVALEEGGMDVILANHALCGSESPSVLELAGQLRPGVPFIFTSGAPDAQAATDALKNGATDYVLEHHPERIGPAVRRALGEVRDEQVYRTAFERAGVGNALLDPRSGRLLRVNRKLCRITGYTESELLNMTFADLVHPDGRAQASACGLAEAHGETSECSLEERHLRKDGRVIWASVQATPVRDDSGRARYVVVTMQDVTRRKQAEEELLRLASNPKPTLTFEISTAGEPTFVDPAARERFPDVAELGRRHPILAGLAEVEREVAETGRELVAGAVWVDGVLYQRLLSKVQGTDSLRLYATGVTAPSRSEGALARSEERYRSLVHYPSDLIMITDADGVLLYESPAVERVLGFRPEERIGTTILSGIHPDDRELVKSRLAALQEAHESRFSVEYRVRDKGGEWHYFEAIGTDLLDDPTVRGVVVNAWEITERRRAEEALRGSEERFRWTFEQAAENIFVVDLQSAQILDANSALQRSLGYTLEELKSMTLYDLVAHDQESVGESLERLVAEGDTFVGERKYRRRDGSVLDVEVTAGAFTYGDRRVACVVAHDITENNRTVTALRKSLSVLLALREAGQVLSSTLESEEIVSRLLDIMRSVAGLTAAVITRYDEKGNLRVWRSAGLESLWPRVRYSPEAESARQAALEGEEQQPFRLRRPGSEDDYLAGLCLPLRARSRIFGVLEAYGRETLAENDMVEIIHSLTSQAAGALENARLYEALGERERELQELVKKLLGTQEEERRRVAYEVHDGLAQVAVAAHQNLQAFARRYAPESEKGRRELDLVLKQVRATVSDARRVIANLRPTALDDLGLAPALSLEVERLAGEGYQVNYEEHLGGERLPAEMEIALFRVAQEGLTNIRKHSGTQWVSIELRRLDGKVRLKIRDFGRGFDPTGPEILGGGPGERVGLAGMKERVSMFGGELEVEGHPGDGTSIVATIPLTRVT
jgi:PAS domain S-box-containing protein